jgi:hypothetical protein
MTAYNKPDISLYTGRRVVGMEHGKLPWQWAIVLEGDVKLINKSREETFPPQFLEGKKITTVIMGVHETAIVFEGVGGRSGFSFNPTQYAIHDPAHGGEVYPQWPEELEESGIPSHPEEEVSSPPENLEKWNRHQAATRNMNQAVTEQAAREFLEEEKNAEA